MTVAAAQGNQLELLGVILDSSLGGTGKLLEDGAGAVILDGATPNTYAGSTIVQNGFLLLNKQTGPAVPGDLTIEAGGEVGLALSNQTAATTNLTVNGGTFYMGYTLVPILNPAADWIFLPGFTPNVTDTIAVLTLNGGSVQILSGATLVLNGDVSVGGTTDSTIGGGGTLDLNGGVLDVQHRQQSHARSRMA